MPKRPSVASKSIIDDSVNFEPLPGLLGNFINWLTELQTTPLKFTQKSITHPLEKDRQISYLIW